MFRVRYPGFNIHLLAQILCAFQVALCSCQRRAFRIRRSACSVQHSVFSVQRSACSAASYGIERCSSCPLTRWSRIAKNKANDDQHARAPRCASLLVQILCAYRIESCSRQSASSQIQYRYSALSAADRTAESGARATRVHVGDVRSQRQSQ